MLFTVYVLYSEKHDKIYIGFTSNLLNRFQSHNQHGTKDWTRKFRPWVVVYCEYFEEKGMAMKREKQMKSAAARQLIRVKLDAEFNQAGFINFHMSS